MLAARSAYVLASVATEAIIEVVGDDDGEVVDKCSERVS